MALTAPAVVAAALAGLLAWAAPAAAHPAPFSYLDLRLSPTELRFTLVLHNLDVAHELALDAADLLDPGVVARIRPRIETLVRERLAIVADGQRVEWALEDIEAARDRDAVALAGAARWPAEPGVLGVRAFLFPYDGAHQTFVTIYEGGEVRTQEILDRQRQAIDYFTGSRQGTRAVIGRFVRSGIEHIFGGPDHVAFIVGLLLLGGRLWRLLGVMTAFTLAHSVTLSLAALDLYSPPSRIIEPAIALSIVYVGADNLLVGRSGRDVRAWAAFVFGLVHGFGFASVLKEFGLPASSLGWALFSFNGGVEIGQALIVLLVAPVISWLQRHRPATAARIAVVGSWGVAAAGVYWFVERLVE